MSPSLFFFLDGLPKIKTIFPMSTHRRRRRAVLCRHAAPFIPTSACERFPFLSAAHGGKMAVQISKKRKVRRWGPGAGDRSAAGVRGFSACCPGARRSVPYPGKWLGPRVIPVGRGWRWMEYGARGERVRCGGERQRRFLPVPGGEQR